MRNLIFILIFIPSCAFAQLTSYQQDSLTLIKYRENIKQLNKLNTGLMNELDALKRIVNNSTEQQCTAAIKDMNNFCRSLNIDIDSCNHLPGLSAQYNLWAGAGAAEKWYSSVTQWTNADKNTYSVCLQQIQINYKAAQDRAQSKQLEDLMTSLLKTAISNYLGK